MGQKKKIKGNPSALFMKKILFLSHAQTWEEAKKEWKFILYYYLLGIYKPCICNPRSIKHAVVLANVITHEEILLCNSCAEDYFDIYDGGKIEFSVSRLLKNNNLGMNPESLAYLDGETILNVREIENYEVGLPSRNDNWVKAYKKRMNKMLLVYTDYKNKETFNKLDCLLVEFTRINNDKDIGTVAYLRYEFLTTGTTNFTEIDELIAQYNININNHTLYSHAHKKLAHKSLEPYVTPSLQDWLHESDYFQKKIKSGVSILPHSAEYEPGFDKEIYLASRKTKHQTINIEGLEDGEDLSHYDDEDDWDDKLSLLYFDDNIENKFKKLLIIIIREYIPEFNVQYLLSISEADSYDITPDSTIRNFVDNLFETSIKCLSLVILRLYNKMAPEDGKYFIKQINRILSKAKIKLDKNSYIFYNTEDIPDYIMTDHNFWNENNSSQLINTEGLEDGVDDYEEDDDDEDD